MATIDELRARAELIAEEQQIGGNTAERVGDAFDMVADIIEAVAPGDQQAVLYTPQSPNEAQKAQARANIGAQEAISDIADFVKVSAQTFTAAQKQQARENIGAEQEGGSVKNLAGSASDTETLIKAANNSNLQANVHLSGNNIYVNGISGGIDLDNNGVNIKAGNSGYPNAKVKINGQEVATKLYVDGKIDDRTDPIELALDLIEAVIPSQASAQNQLADKAFVNSSISSSTANFVGTFDSLAELQAIQNPTNNDYGFVIETDAVGNEYYDRYKYNGTSWLFEYKVESTPFTADQWAAIQSGITSALVGKLSALPTNAELTTTLDAKADKSDTYTKAQVDDAIAAIDVSSQISGKTDKVTNATNGDFASLDANGNLVDSGKKAADFATASQGEKADSALQRVDMATVNGSDITHGGNVTIVAAEGQTITIDAAPTEGSNNAVSSGSLYPIFSSFDHTSVPDYAELAPWTIVYGGDKFSDPTFEDGVLTIAHPGAGNDYAGLFLGHFDAGKTLQVDIASKTGLLNNTVRVAIGVTDESIGEPFLNLTSVPPESGTFITADNDYYIIIRASYSARTISVGISIKEVGVVESTIIKDSAIPQYIKDAASEVPGLVNMYGQHLASLDFGTGAVAQYAVRLDAYNIVAGHRYAVSIVTDNETDTTYFSTRTDASHTVNTTLGQGVGSRSFEFVASGDAHYIALSYRYAGTGAVFGISIVDLSIVSVYGNHLAIESLESRVGGGIAMPEYAQSEQARVYNILIQRSLLNVHIAAFNTDQHFNIDAASGSPYDPKCVMQGVQAMLNIANLLPIDEIVFGGDAPGYGGTGTSYTPDGIMQTIAYLLQPTHDTNAVVVSLPGNHDAWQNNNQVTAQGMYNVNAKRNQRHLYYKGNGTDNCDAWVDDTEHKIRSIYVDVQSRNVRTEDFRVFLANALSTLPEGYMAVCFSHMALTNEFAGVVKAQKISDPSVEIDAFQDPFDCHAILNQYADKIICCINGHAHCDASAVSAAGILYIETTTAAPHTRNYTTDNIPNTSTMGTVTDTSFDFFVIDQAAQTIEAVRYGQGCNRKWIYKGANAGMMSGYPETIIRS